MTPRRLSSPEEPLTPLQINWDAVAVLGIFFASFALYARTAAPGVLDGDFGEFQTNIYKLGVSHTGYPFYFLLAKLWTLVMPVGTVAYRANVFSGLLGALTLVLIYAMMRTLTERRAVALLTAILFGISRVQWSQAVVPDVYTLNSFFIVLVLWLAILWRIGHAPLWWLALAYGLSLTHHRTMILLAPALAIFVLLGAGRALFQPRELLINLAALFSPLLLYLYIPLRGASDVGVEYHPGNNVNLLALNAFYDLRFGPPGFLWERVTQTYLPLLIEQFTVFGFALGWLGIVALAVKRAPRGFPPPLPPRHLLALLGLAHVAETAFAICFWVFDSEIFFIPSYLTFLFFTGIGLAIALDGFDARLASNVSQRAARGIALGLVIVVCAFLLVNNFARNDQSSNDVSDARWREILAQPLEQNATLMGPWQDLTPLEYYQYVEGVRPDLKRDKVVLFQDQLKLAPQSDLPARVRRAQAQGLYLTRHPDDTETLGDLNKQNLIPIASLWRVTPRGKYDFVSASYGAGDALQRVRTNTFEPHAGDFVPFVLDWSTDAPLDRMRLRVRLRDVGANLWAEYETLPLGGREGTRREANKGDMQGIFIPPDAPPGQYTLEIAAFERISQEPLPLVGDDNRAALTLDVTAPPHVTARARLQIPRPLEAAVAKREFLGFAVDNSEPRGGDVLEFSSWWQNVARGDEQFEIKLRDANQTETVLYRGALFPDARGAFNPNQIVRARHTLTIPPTAAPGSARMLLSLDGQSLPPLRLSLRESQRKFRVPIIQRPQLTLVGDTLQLLGYKLDRTQFRAGDASTGSGLPLTLYWNANRTPDASYKVFVHLVDASGVLRAQQDSIPQGGGLPTDRWFPGEYITDEYAVPLPRDLAPGEYRLRVGMYDEATGVRVPLRDANGVRVPDDAVTLGDRILIRE